MKAICDLIDERYNQTTGTTIKFMADATFVDQLIQASQDYPQYFLTADPQEGIRKLNDLVARRALRALTQTDAAGQYVAGNVLYRQTHALRHDDDGMEDHTRQGSAVTLAGNIFRKRNADFQARQKQIRDAYLNNTYSDRFVATEYRDSLDSRFREL